MTEYSSPNTTAGEPNATTSPSEPLSITPPSVIRRARTPDHVPKNESQDEDRESDDEEEIDSGDDDTQTVMGPELMNRRFDLHGTMYKRRGGFKLKDNKWVLRCFTLYGPILCYYDDPEMQRSDPSRPRGRINLGKEDTIADMHSKKKAGAPTTYILTINIYGIGGKRKWDLCCTDQQQQKTWYEALSRYDGKDVQLPEESPTATATAGPAQPQQHTRKNRLVKPTTSTPPSPMKKRVPSRRLVHANSRKATSSKALTTTVPFLKYIDDDVIVQFVGLNVATYLVRVGTTEIFWIIVMVLNLALIYHVRNMRDKQDLTLSRTYSTEHLLRMEERESVVTLPEDLEGLVEEEEEEEEVEVDEPPTAFAGLLDAGSTIHRAAPLGATKEAIDLHGIDSPAAMTACAAPDVSYEPTPHSYWNVKGETFNLRTGPNYKKNKTKGPSAPPLYDLYAVDMFQAGSTLKRVNEGFRIPEIKGITDVETGNPHVPPMMVITCNMPSDEPKMWGSEKDGNSYIVVLYLVISKATLEALKDLETASAAVKLFVEWCKRGETEFDFRGRFKAMCVLDDIDNLGLPSFITGYNGKPTLISKSGTFTRYDNYIEMSINVHIFAYLARKGLYSLHHKFPSFILNVGFTIEGRDDDELPETLLGGCRMINLDLSKAKHHSDYL